jgi:nucleoid DNA-binding protein
MSEKITFKQLVELIAKQSKQSESSANSFIHELVHIIEGGLKQSGSVSISGFGKFELRWMKERSGVNPQTGDEITIPGQNKVVFKPYKALRETVNHPFANLEPEILNKKSESEESSEKEDEISEENDPFGLNDVFGSEEPENSESDDESSDSSDPFDSDPSFDPDDPFGIDKKAKESNISKDYNKYVDDLIYEIENPHFGGSSTQSSEETEESDDDILVLEREDEWQDDQKPKITPSIPDESKMARKVQESGSFKWSYAAAVIIVMVALILLFWMMQRSGDPIEETASTSESPNQTEQVIEPSTSADSEADGTSGATADQETTPEDEATQPTVDQESPPASVDRQAQNNIETEPFTVESGQSLWDIAENQLGNPYFWPVIYYLNQDDLSNPNQLLTNSDIEIPTFSDPDNLSEFEREQVALGYFSLYQWNRENNPDEARYFLWAVGVFSQDLLDQPPSDVDSEDLAFARNR